MAHKIISHYLDTVGDQTGLTNAIGDETPGEFFIQAQPGQQLVIARLIVYIEDGVTGKFDPGKYGDIAALPNGIKVQVRESDDEVINDLTNGHAIHTNGQWQQVCFDVSVLDNNSTMSLAVRWTYDKSIPQGYGEEGHTPIVLNPGQKFSVIVNDNFTGLLSHHFLVQGVETVPRAT